LRTEFEPHSVSMLIAQTLQNDMEALKDIEVAIELAPYGINYEPRRAIKAEALANFTAKCLMPIVIFIKNKV